MGQKAVADSSTLLIHYSTTTNTRQAYNYTPLSVCPAITVPSFKKFSHFKNKENLEFNFKFMPKLYVNVILKYKTEELENQGVLFSAADTIVFGYKHKIRAADILKKQTSFNRNEAYLFKKRIYGELDDIVQIFAEMKLLSILEIGPYIGRMADGSDAYLGNGFLQFFGEVTLNTKIMPENAEKIKDKVAEEIRKKKLQILSNSNFDIAFSSFQKAHIIKLISFHCQKQKMGSGEEPTLISVNNALAYLKRQYDEEAQKTVAKIDAKTKMMSSIENQIIQKNIDRAVDIFEDNVAMIDNDEEKLKYAYQFCDILAENRYFTEYEEQVINEVLTAGSILKQTTIQTPYGSKLQERLNSLKLKSSDFGSETEIEEFSKSFSREDTSRNSIKSLKMEQLKLNIQGNNRKRAEQIMSDLKKLELTGQKQKYDEYTSFEIQLEYGTILMKSGKSRHALILFQTMNRSDIVPYSMKIKMYNYMGIIYFYKNKFSLAIRQFQNSLNILYLMKSYSPAMMLAFNNIGCSYYRQNDLNKSLEFFCRVLSCGESCVDYEMMARSNKGMALIEKKMFKEARHEFMMILKMIEPINNASILCKTYSNLGYLNMIENNFNEALTDFEIANKIEGVCLTSNNYKPSIFLHNNIAMVYFKKKQYRKALAHLQKCKDQIEMLKDLDAMLIHFNFAMTYQKCYFHEFALKHLTESRRLLQRLNENQRYTYQKKIQIQIQKLNSIRIIEDSEQSAHQSISSRYSSTKKYL